MNPKHNPDIPEFILIQERGRNKNIQRRAIAPYNFVELPEKVVEVSPESLPQENRYYLRCENRYTGRIDCIVFDCLVFESDSSAGKFRLDKKAVDDYRNALTNFQQKEPPFDRNWGMLNENCSVIFYYPPANGSQVVFFGQSPNFRIPYSHKGDGYAATVSDFIPPSLTSLKNTSKNDLIDFADAIFGWVKKDNDRKLPENIRQCASRVFITDAQYKSNERDIWYKGNFNDTVTPQILSEPKPTCYQHYLVQRKEDNPQSDKSKLKHYASQPESETVIRGHKLYWHKGIQPDIEHPEGNNASGTQITKIKPINRGVKFGFTIHFENLSNRKNEPRINDSNEYKERPVLPTPLQVMGWDDNRIINNLPPSPLNSGNPTDTPKPRPKLKPKGSDLDRPIQKDKQSQQKPKDNSEGVNFNAIARPPKPKK